MVEDGPDPGQLFLDPKGASHLAPPFLPSFFLFLPPFFFLFPSPSSFRPFRPSSCPP